MNRTMCALIFVTSFSLTIATAAETAQSAAISDILALFGISSITFLVAVALGSESTVTPQRQIADKAEKVAQELETVETQIEATRSTERAAFEIKWKVLLAAGKDLEIKHDRALGKSSGELFTDILYDLDGVQLHRFQKAAWTLIFGLILIFGVVRNLQLPALGVTVLKVMGISSDTHLRFKFPALKGNES